MSAGIDATLKLEAVMRRLAIIISIIAVFFLPNQQSGADDTQPPVPNAATLDWPAGLPVYDHIVIVIDENKDYDEIIGNLAAPYINNMLKKEGANFTHMFGEEHLSEGNYFWLFSGDNQSIGFKDDIPTEENNHDYPFTGANLGQQLINKGHSFKGYSEGLPEIGFSGARQDLYARKHVPWISFANVPNGATVATLGSWESLVGSIQGEFHAIEIRSGPLRGGGLHRRGGGQPRERCRRFGLEAR
jgi:hypothetical protein